jgi:hypothetical protein
MMLGNMRPDFELKKSGSEQGSGDSGWKGVWMLPIGRQPDDVFVLPAGVGAARGGPFGLTTVAISMLPAAGSRRWPQRAGSVLESGTGSRWDAEAR